MGTEALIAILVGVATVIGALFTAATYYRQPKRRITISSSLTDLLTESVQSFGDVSVVHAGTKVLSPTVVEITFEATGRGDITSEQFDAQRPLRVDCGGPIIALTTDRDETIRVGGDGRSILVGPMLLKRKEPQVAQVLIDGAAEIELIAADLADTKVVTKDESPYSSESADVKTVFMTGVTSGLFAAALAAGAAVLVDHFLRT